MKRKTIIGLAVAVGLLLIGAAAYGHWNDYGPQGNYGTGYGCGYGYNANVNDPATGTYMPCSGYYGGGNWNTHDNRYNYGNDWTGHRGRWMMGPRGCW